MSVQGLYKVIYTYLVSAISTIKLIKNFGNVICAENYLCHFKLARSTTVLSHACSKIKLILKKINLVNFDTGNTPINRHSDTCTYWANIGFLVCNLGIGMVLLNRIGVTLLSIKNVVLATR